PAWREGKLSAFSGRTFFYEQAASPETTNDIRRVVAELLRQAGIQQPSGLKKEDAVHGGHYQHNYCKQCAGGCENKFFP
ncbi:MAG: hypothetical protein K2G28_12315, partial [Acetatifactor sp.]|nr:hypothetical protein [Acetatifactor sp.]